MPVIPAELVHSNPGLDTEQIIAKLLGGETLLSDTPDHLIEVVDVLESYGEVLDAYSKNLIYEGNTSSSIHSRFSSTSTATSAPRRSGATSTTTGSTSSTPSTA